MKLYNIYTHKHDKNKIMNITEVRNVVRLAIAEAMEKGGLPKSGGKLVHLKKELEGLKKMKESLGSYTINEGGDGQFVAEYAHMQKFVTELEKIKMAHAKLSEMLDSQISEVEGKVSSETQKVKEMMGLIEKAPKKPAAKKDDKKAPAKKDDKKAEKKDDKKDEKKPVKEDASYNNMIRKKYTPEEKAKFEKIAKGAKNYSDAVTKLEAAGCKHADVFAEDFHSGPSEK
jgi:flagellar biosynthesis chaperone FliJ